MENSRPVRHLHLSLSGMPPHPVCGSLHPSLARNFFREHGGPGGLPQHFACGVLLDSERMQFGAHACVCTAYVCLCYRHLLPLICHRHGLHLILEAGIWETLCMQACVPVCACAHEEWVLRAGKNTRTFKTSALLSMCSSDRLLSASLFSTTVNCLDWTIYNLWSPTSYKNTPIQYSESCMLKSLGMEWVTLISIYNPFLIFALNALWRNADCYSKFFSPNKGEEALF